MNAQNSIGAQKHKNKVELVTDTSSLIHFFLLTFTFYLAVLLIESERISSRNFLLPAN